MTSRRVVLTALSAVAFFSCKPAPYEYPDAGPQLRLDTVAPAEAFANENVALTLVGAGFKPGLVVLMGGRVVGGVTVINPAVLSVPLQRGSMPGIYDVGVVNPDGERTNLDDALTILPDNVLGGGGGSTGGGGGGSTGGGGGGSTGGSGGGSTGGGGGGSTGGGGGSTGGGGGAVGGGGGAVDAGPTPAGLVFALGVTDNAFAAPQSAPRLNLVFEVGTATVWTVVSKRTSVPPTLDGLETEWSVAPASVVALQEAGSLVGFNRATWDAEMAGFGRTWPWDFGVYAATVKSMYDDQNIYFMVRWSDATENSARAQLSWDADGGLWRRSTSDEDRLTLSFNINDSFPEHNVIGCTAACHLGKNVGDFSDAGRSYRMSMHTNDAGQLADVWEWDSTSTNPMGQADDSYWNQSRRNADSSTSWTISNIRSLSDGGVEPFFMSPAGIGANPAALYNLDAGRSPVAVPYDGTGVAEGATVPGYVHRMASPLRNDVFAKGRWQNGFWTVEFSRARLTVDPNDAQFPNQ